MEDGIKHVGANDGGEGTRERGFPLPALVLPSGLEGDERAWVDCVREMGRAAREAVMPLTGTSAGRAIVGRGQGGDMTVELDAVAEKAMLASAESHAPAPYSVVSEELGTAGDPGAPWRLVIDPVDGSLNAKRGVPVFSAVVAVAAGNTLGDVRVGYVIDLPGGAEYLAVRGRGGTASRRVQAEDLDPYVEVVLLEAGRPGGRAFSFADLSRLAGPGGRAEGLRVRQLGSLALSLCQVAVGAADVLVSPVPSRAVDIAAGLAMVREAGGGAAALDGSELWAQPLDLRRRASFMAWRPGLDGERLLAEAAAVFSPV